MDIGVLGATGLIGRAVVAEGLRRGHRVTALTRDPARVPTEGGGATWRVADAGDAEGAARAVAGLDVMVNAIAPGGDIPDQIAHAHVLPDTARALLKALELHPATRLIVIGGGGSLESAPGVRVLDDEEGFARVLTEVLHVPAAYRAVALAHAEVLDLCRLSDRNWTYLSPSAGRIEPGDRTGRYRVGGDQVLPPVEGAGDISTQDLAVAVLDEIESPRYVRRRFTAGY
ncbi:NAD(P)-dependent oxidoreductase [Streptomyces triculaminicus]|uniref:NAD(P)-dependent oxidoreductase n=1 Tax=Streptomyces triculaminicus TaxID=2816232 RepID=UPI0037CE4C4E